MTAKRGNAKPRSSATGAVQTPAPPDEAGIYAERLAGAIGEIGEQFKPSTDLQVIAQRFAAAAETPNGRGWVRLTELLEQVAEDPEVRASLGASEFLAIMTVLAGDGLFDDSASPRLRELYSLMSNRGGGARPRIDAAAVARLAAAGMRQEDIARRLECSVRHVRRLLKEKPHS